MFLREFLLVGIVVEQRVKLSYSDISQKVTVSTKTILSLHNSSIRSPKIVNSSSIQEEFTLIREADSVVDMTPGFKSLYIYTDAVGSRVVGDSLVPPLRIVPIQVEHGRTMSSHFEDVCYKQ